MQSETKNMIGVLPQFERLVRPLDEQGRKELKEEVMDVFPDSRVIHTWCGKHLLDKERCELCKELNLEITIKEMVFTDWKEAAEYICSEQLKRYGVDSKYGKYLIGQLLHIRTLTNKEQGKAQKKMDIVKALGEEWKLSGISVSRYSRYADTISEIYGHSDELAWLILSDKMNITYQNVTELSHLKPEEIRAIAKEVQAENIDNISLSFIRSAVKRCYVQQRGAVSRKEKEEKELSVNAGIRQMPKYDPDSGVNILCMTIESWISSIQRVRSSEDFERISDKASLRLMKKLSGLEYVINTVQESLVERTKL